MNTVEPIRDMDLVMDLAEYLKSNNERDYVLFMFGIYTGLRISDILKFRIRDVREKDADRKSTRLNSSHRSQSRMPSSA